MRNTKPTSQFIKDYKREQKGIHQHKIQGKDSALETVIRLLSCDELLPPKYRDHKLQGQFSDCRDCHIASDLVLIYRLVDENILQLVRLGSHSELF